MNTYLKRIHFHIFDLVQTKFSLKKNWFKQLVKQNYGSTAG